MEEALGEGLLGMQIGQPSDEGAALSGGLVQGDREHSKPIGQLSPTCLPGSDANAVIILSVAAPTILTLCCPAVAMLLP